MILPRRAAAGSCTQLLLHLELYSFVIKAVLGWNCGTIQYTRNDNAIFDR